MEGVDADGMARVLYLVLLGGGLLFFLGRGGLGGRAALRSLLIWALVIAALAVGYTLFTGGTRTGGAPAAVEVAGEALVLRRGPGGHFLADADVNGAPVRFMVDTGATDIVLSADDARSAGIDPGALAYLGRAETANGTVRTAAVRLDRLGFGDVALRDVRATVSEGAMPLSLLGMAFLSRFGRIEIEGDEMRLIR